MTHENRETESKQQANDAGNHAEVDGRISHLEALELVGQVCSQIGHDINNLVGSIQGCAEILDRRLTRDGLDAPHRKQFEIIQSAAKKVARMTLQLRSWARTGPLPRQPTLITELLQTVETRLQEQGARFDIVLMNAPPDTELSLNVTACSQMVVNIALDAMEAMRKVDERVLILQVEERKSDDGERFIDIIIGDNGRGVASDSREKLFHPLRASVTRTTPSDHAFGLSLPMAWAVMNKHEGTVEVRSRAEVGTAVRISFPVITKTIQS